MDEDRLVKRKNKARRDGNVHQLAELSKELGDMYFESGRLDQALSEYNEQLQACEVLADKLNHAIAHRMIGEVNASLGNYEEALTHQTLHLEGAKEVNNVLEQQRALATIGRTQFCLGETLPENSDQRTEAFAAAKKAYSKSLRLCDRLESTDIELAEMMTMRARLLLNLGLVLEEQKNPHQAIELIEKAAELCKKHKLDDDLHRTDIALGALHERQNHFGLALKHIDKAIETGDSTLRAHARLTKAELLLRLGQWSDARKILVHLFLSKNRQLTILRQVEKLLRIVVTICRAEESLEVETDPESRQKLYEQLGDAAVAARSYTKAIEYYSAMLIHAETSDSPEQIGLALVSLVQTLRDAHRYDEAIPHARRELELCTEPSEICRSALNLVDLLCLTNSDKSSILETYNHALETARKHENPTMEATILKEMRIYYQDTGDHSSASEITKKLDDQFSTTILDSPSDTESENTNIGSNICLEDLSDVETEICKNNEKSVDPENSRSRKRGLVVKRNAKGETKLHVACINGNIDEVERLLEAGHPTNVRDNAGWTPLHEAANHGYVEIAKLLIKSKAHVNDAGGAECGGVTPLHDAASCGNFSIITLLMKSRANFLLTTREGDNALDCLENWRERVGDLSEADQRDYEIIRKKLSKVLTRRSERSKESSGDRNATGFNGLVDEEDEEDDEEQISASEDYRRTIANLMNRSSTFNSSKKGEKRSSTTPKRPQAALIDCDETMIDDWLEDDLNCTIKERSIVEDRLPTIKRKSSNSTPEGQKSVKRQRIRSNDNSELVTNGDESSSSSCSSATIDVSLMNESRRNSSVAKSAKKTKKRQISLLKAGFTRDSASRTPSPIFINCPGISNAPEIIEDNVLRKSMKLLVLIDGKIVNFTLTYSERQKSTVASITREIADKYRDETGCVVRIRLTSWSGEVIEADDTLRVVNPVDGVVRLIAEIVDREIPSVVERYTSICKSHRIQPSESTTKSLKICDNTSTFRLKHDKTTTYDEKLVILKTLEHEEKLQILELSGSSLNQLGKTLNDTLKRLSKLQELHLRGCDMDLDCLLKIDSLPSQLRVIDLSYNPLGNSSHDQLHKLISHHRHLQTLKLRMCEIEKFTCSKNWTHLVNLDLSWNPVDDEITESFVGQMLSLNLSNTVRENGNSIVRSIVNASTSTLENLENLELSCCNVGDRDVIDIIAKTPNLSKFVLTGNDKVGVIGLSAMLKRKPTLTLIEMTNCEKIVEVPDDDVYMENPRSCTLIVTMSKNVKQSWLCLWRGTADVCSFPHNVVKFKPILR